MPQPSISLDHIILLIPHSTLKQIPAWLSDTFTISPGGTHADGKTVNKLILLQSGVYIELIAFVDDSPANRDGHWWGKKEPGIIDFACTSTDQSTTVAKFYEDLTERLKGNRASYAKPRAGGRKRPDGAELKWQVTFPENVTRGELPFFCHDVTERELRAPMREEGVKHPGDVVGVKELSIILTEERAKEFVGQYSAVLGVENLGKDGEGVFRVGSLFPVKGDQGPLLRVRFPGEGESELSRLVEERGVVVGELVFRRKEGGERVRIDDGVGMGGIYLE